MRDLPEETYHVLAEIGSKPVKLYSESPGALASGVATDAMDLWLVMPPD